MGSIRLAPAEVVAVGEKQSFQLKRCEHENRDWSPAIIARWSDGAQGSVRHLIPVGYCEECTRRLTVDDFISDEIWDQCQSMLVRNGYPKQSRKFNRIEWTRADRLAQQLDKFKSSVIDSISFNSEAESQ